MSADGTDSAERVAAFQTAMELGSGHLAKQFMLRLLDYQFMDEIDKALAGYEDKFVRRRRSSSSSFSSTAH